MQEKKVRLERKGLASFEGDQSIFQELVSNSLRRSLRLLSRWENSLCSSLPLPKKFAFQKPNFHFCTMVKSYLGPASIFSVYFFHFQRVCGLLTTALCLVRKIRLYRFQKCLPFKSQIFIFDQWFRAT